MHDGASGFARGTTWLRLMSLAYCSRTYGLAGAVGVGAVLSFGVTGVGRGAGVTTEGAVTGGATTVGGSTIGVVVVIVVTGSQTC